MQTLPQKSKVPQNSGGTLERTSLFPPNLGHGDLVGFKFWKKGKDPHPQDKIQHLDFTKDPRPLYYKSPVCAFYHKKVCSKAVFGP